MRPPTLLQLLAFSCHRPRAVLLFRDDRCCAVYGPHQDAVADACRETGVTFICRDIGQVCKLAFPVANLPAVVHELRLAGRRVTILSTTPNPRKGV
jgi:hypothetical protein